MRPLPWSEKSQARRIRAMTKGELMADELRAHDVTKFTAIREVETRPTRRYFTLATRRRARCEGCGTWFEVRRGSKGRFHSLRCCRDFWHRERGESPVMVAQRRAEAERLARAGPPVHQSLAALSAPRPGSIALGMLGYGVYGKQG